MKREFYHTPRRIRIGKEWVGIGGPITVRAGLMLREANVEEYLQLAQAPGKMVKLVKK